MYIWYCWCFRNLAAAPMSGEVVCPIVEDWLYRSQVVELVILTSPKFLEFWLRIWKKQSTMSFHSSLMPDRNFAQQKTHTHSQKPQIMWQTLALGAWPWRGWKLKSQGVKCLVFFVLQLRLRYHASADDVGPKLCLAVIFHPFGLTHAGGDPDNSSTRFRKFSPN